jgi:hypothetical protein
MPATVAGSAKGDQVVSFSHASMGVMSNVVEFKFAIHEDAFAIKTALPLRQKNLGTLFFGGNTDWVAMADWPGRHAHSFSPTQDHPERQVPVKEGPSVGPSTIFYFIYPLELSCRILGNFHTTSQTATGLP